MQAANLAFVFPGQGSQSLGMLAELGSEYSVVKSTFDEASAGAGVDLWVLSQRGPEEDLNRTENTQPALLAAGVAVWRVWHERGGATPAMLAGHSLGEYAALVCAEVLGMDAPMHKYAIQVTVADQRDGALSGSTLKEASSWGKVDLVYEQMVFAEATIAMPLIAGYAYHRGAHKERTGKKFAELYDLASV